jgi:hypothetical protein
VAKAKPKLNKVHVIRDKRFGSLPWIVLFVNKELRESPIEWCNDEKGTRIGVHSKWRTKRLAVAEAIAQAKCHEPCSLRIHKPDGRIQEERTYGNDPKRTKG